MLRKKNEESRKKNLIKKNKRIKQLLEESWSRF